MKFWSNDVNQSKVPPFVMFSSSLYGFFPVRYLNILFDTLLKLRFAPASYGNKLSHNFLNRVY
jgi:hypothetical protein